MKERSKMVFWAIVLGTMFIFFLMNVFTHRISDDFYWGNIPGTSQRVQSVHDIFRSIHGYYMATEGTAITGGRILAVFFTQFFIMLGKTYFNIANAFAYIALVLLMYFHIVGSLKRINYFIFMAINLFLWFLVPSWWENFLWLTGSCFYVWPMVIMLFFLVPLRNKCANPNYSMNIPLSICYSILGLLAGLTYENLAAGVFVALICYFAVRMIRKEKIALFEIAGVTGFLIGFAILVAAPGNFSRLEGHETFQQHNFLQYIFHRTFVTTHVFFSRNGALLAGLSAILCLELLLHQKKKIFSFSFLYIGIGIVATYSMIIVPVFLERAFFPVTIFLIIGFLNLFLQVEWPQLLKRNLKLFTILALLIFSASLLREGYTIMAVYRGDISYSTTGRQIGHVQ